MAGIVSDLTKKIRRPPRNPPQRVSRGVSGRFPPGQHGWFTRYNQSISLFNLIFGGFLSFETSVRRCCHRYFDCCCCFPENYFVDCYFVAVSFSFQYLLRVSANTRRTSVLFPTHLLRWPLWFCVF